MDEIEVIRRFINCLTGMSVRRLSSGSTLLDSLRVLPYFVVTDDRDGQDRREWR
jgi:hypothetical protein